MAQFPDMLILLRQLAGLENSLRLLNHYKGVPINHDAMVINIGNDAVLISASQYQIVCMVLERSTYLQSPYLPSAVKADVLGVDVGRTLVWIGNFQPADEGIGERQQIRVEPAEVLKASFSTKGVHHDVPCEIANISLNGIAIILERLAYVPRLYQVGTELTMKLKFLENINIPTRRQATTDQGDLDLGKRFSRDQLRGTAAIIGPDTGVRNRLPAQTGPLKPFVRGTIRNIKNELHMNRVRLGIQLYPDELVRVAMVQYISQRQSEIVRELKNRYDLLIRMDQQGQSG